MMGRQCDDKITRGIKRVAVIDEYSINKGCQCWCSTSWTGNVWKKKR